MTPTLQKPRIPQFSPEAEMLLRRRQLSPTHLKLMALLEQDEQIQGMSSKDPAIIYGERKGKLLDYLNRFFAAI
ncbi:MAG TPA: hypothetical protein P5550_11500 [Bacteroidales bacterium]|nr:hypothetical protein [Bacteroidales bacterium]HRZ75898.1 hypothetical protein [Bacteroidales bacterium]